MNKSIQRSVRPWYAYALAFTDGVIITAAELSATPLLAPAFGTSLLVWTSVIGVVLAALAVGYSIGGRLADRSESMRPLLLWLLVGAILIAFVPFLAAWLFPTATLFGALTGSVSAGRLIATFVVMMLSLALPMVLLSMTSPYVISMLQRSEAENHVGQTAGRVYTISTIGSLIGVFVGPLVLLPLLGTRLLFVSLGVVLFLLVVPGLMQIWGKRAASVVAVLLVVVLATPALSPVLAREGVIDETESFLQYIAVVETEEGVRQLRVNEGLGVQSSWDPSTPYAGNYTDIFALVPLLQDPPEDKHIRVLSLGLAGGSGPRALEAALDPSIELHIDGVEIDPEMVRLARTHFALDDIESLEVHVSDGRSFLQDVDTLYDFIYVDAFQNETTAPPELATQEFFEEARAHLEPEG
ncbi:MAG: fused MFS/spermidine synthase, partial [Candidatus Andersenbacteria bacterium]|nr:fused MFS/spermidine synthase [Candidatus Andersenbacteria bacterium]